MGLPIPFLAGLVVLLMHEEFGGSLPGEESAPRMAAALLLMFVPWGVARGTARWLRNVAISGVAPSLLLRIVLLLQPALVPLCYAGIVFWGGLPEFAWQLSPDSQLTRLVLLAGPLVLMEVSMRIAERRAVRYLAVFRLTVPPQLGTDRLAMTFFVLMPVLALAGVADVLALNRSLELFFFETSVGTAIGFLLLVGVLCVMLPLTFRWLMPVSTELPVHLAHDLRRTAESLGFSGRAMLLMRTGHRMVNAALVGPAPWPRFLVLTDGLLALLDPSSLRGVVAHEVGHAKANHPAILLLIFACMPVFLFYPAVVAGVTDMSEPDLALLGGGLLVAGIIGLRVLAHRFEYEADQLSAEALGGASFCVQALQRVGELSPRSLRKSSFRHPSEARRIRHLYACERNEQLRQQFWRRGRLVRAAVFAVLTVSFGACVWALVALWPVDRVGYLFYSARFSEARDQLAAIPSDLPGSRGTFVAEMRGVVDAGIELGLPEGDWYAVRDQLASGAEQRAIQAVTRRDFKGALPWLYLALEQRLPPDWLRSLYLYCRAVTDEDAEAEERVREHLLALDAPPEIAAAMLR